MSKKPRRSYSREVKMEPVRLVNEKDHCIAEASRNLSVEYSVLRRWKNQPTRDPENALPGKEKQKAPDEQMKQLQRELKRVKEERDI